MANKKDEIIKKYDEKITILYDLNRRLEKLINELIEIYKEKRREEINNANAN